MYNMCKKRIKRRNKQKFSYIKWKKLIFHSLDQALKVKKIDNIVISSDVKLSRKELKKEILVNFF